MTLVPRFPWFPAFLFLAALTASAETRSDVGVAITPRVAEFSSTQRVPLGHHVDFDVVAFWNGFGPAENVVVDADVPGTIESVAVPADGTIACSNARPIRCTVAANVAIYRGVITIATTQGEAGSFTAQASIRTTSLDDSQGNDRASVPLEVVAQPALRLGGEAAPKLEPGQTATAGVDVFNGGAAANGVTTTLTLPEGGTFVSVRPTFGSATCEVEPARAVCATARLDYGGRVYFEVRYRAPERLTGGDVVLHAETQSLTADFTSWLIEHFPVTTIADEGPGTLRQALLDARPRCVERSCTIDFRIPGPVPDGTQFTIRPLTPLPEVWGRVKIDGSTQTAVTGPTNGRGPEIAIDGSALPAGTNGFVLRTSCDVAIFELEITKFPRHAIEIDNGTQPIGPCPYALYYPVIARNRLTANERGVVVATGSRIEIDDNVITGNRRAGIFINTAFYANILGNTITGNGASGIFVNIDQGGRSTVAGADISQNVIAGNGEWGLCRTGNGAVAVTGNSIYGNVSAGIDINLDNDTPNRPDDKNTFPNKPEIFSATYDPGSDTTVVRGRLDSNEAIGQGGGYTIDVYASSSLSLWGYAQGEKLVGTKQLGGQGHTGFEIAVPGDLRGKFITATNTRSHVVGFAQPPMEQSHTASIPTETSEFSNAVEVR